MRKSFFFLALLLAGCAKLPQSPDTTRNQGDAAFASLTQEYLTGYLAWRPQTGTALGFHQYDGKVTDFSRQSLQGEVARLKSFDGRLTAIDADRLSKRAEHDYRLLRGAIRREIFGFEQMQSYSRNP